MKISSILLCLLAVAAWAGGCRQAEPVEDALVTDPAPTVFYDTLTLSAEQLVALDFSGRSPAGPKVARKHAVDGAGAVFDIYFPTNKPWQNSINYVSSGSGGQMALVGIDAAAFRSFALKFTLVAIDGAVGPTLPQELLVGAVAGPTPDGRLSQYEPVSLSFAGQQTGISRTRIGVPRLREIGIRIEMANPEAWSPDGTLVTLLVEPVDEAMTPSPSTLMMEEKEKESPTPAPEPVRGPNFGPGRTGAW